MRRRKSGPEKRGPGGRGSRRPRGFTLIEIVMVLVITGLMLSLALPRVNLAGYRADAGMQGVRSLLMLAQRTSLERQYDVVVMFDTTKQRITILEDANDNATIDPGEHIRRQALQETMRFVVPVVGIDGAVNHSLTGPSLHQVNSLPSITFHGLGRETFDEEIASTVEWLGRHPGFGGVAVHFYESFRELVEGDKEVSEVESQNSRASGN